MRYGIIGGTGVYQPGDLPGATIERVHTPYGDVEVTVGTYEGKEVAFLPRHGKGHSVPPHRVNYRANIWALKELGVTTVLATAAVGSLNRLFRPGDLVVIDDVIDWTKGRPSTFFEQGPVVHIDFSDPYCGRVRKGLVEVAHDLGLRLHHGGVYVCAEGPRFESKAEIALFARLGGDVVGMTSMPEAALAKEAEMCYATVCMVTNWARGWQRSRSRTRRSWRRCGRTWRTSDVCSSPISRGTMGYETARAGSAVGGQVPLVRRERDVRAIRYQPDRLELLDQTRLPHEAVWVTCRSAEDVYEAIRSMQVRGTPAIGAAAAFGLALEARRLEQGDVRSRLREVSVWMKTARPTAVNLMQAIDEVMEALEDAPPGGEADALYRRAVAIAERDIETNRRIGEIGARLIAKHGGRVLTHCNTGSLATVEYGTALGILRAMRDAGTLKHVYVDETRPYLQGARLTAYELVEEGIPFDIITDSTAGFAMKLGSDRRRGRGRRPDRAKRRHGEQDRHVLARGPGIPPRDPVLRGRADDDGQSRDPSGDEIPIEERSADEVTHLMGRPIAPAGTSARHLAFDVTPNHLITAIITEAGVASRRTPIRLRGCARRLSGRRRKGEVD